MALTLIGNPKASCTVKVLLTLAEKGITDYNFNSVDLGKGEQKVCNV
jgi:glutathione S-transferase